MNIRKEKLFSSHFILFHHLLFTPFTYSTDTRKGCTSLNTKQPQRM